MCGMISRYPSMIKTLERSVRIALAHRGETRDPWRESFSTNRDSRDGYLWTMYEWKFWPSSWSTHPPISMRRKWTQYFRGEENRHSRFPSASSSNPLGEWNRTRRNSVATSPIEQRASLLLEWRGLEAVAFFETAGGKERNDRKRWAAREGGEERRKEKKERYASGPFSRRREGKGNSKEAGISSAFAWKYRSRNGIPIDRIFRSGEIQAYLPYFRASLSFDCTTFRF